MPPSSLPQESIIWEGSYVYPLRLPIVTLLSFFGVVAMGGFGILGVIIAFFIFLLFLFLLFLSLWVLRRRDIRYYVTNLRVMRGDRSSSNKNRELRLDQVEAVVVRQDFLSKMRDIGTVYFDGVVFERVKEPNHVRRLALEAKSRIPYQQPLQTGGPVIREIIRESVLVQCRYCGARAQQGTLRCPKCGANL